MKKFIALIMGVVMMVGIIPVDVAFGQVIMKDKGNVQSSETEYNIQIDKTQDPYGGSIDVYRYDPSLPYEDYLTEGLHNAGELQFYLKTWDEGNVNIKNIELSIKNAQDENISYSIDMIKVPNYEGTYDDAVLYTIDLQEDVIISFTGVELYKYTLTTSFAENDEYEIKNVRREIHYQEEAPDEFTEGEWKVREELIDGEYNEETGKTEYKDLKWFENIIYDVEVASDVEPIVVETLNYKGQSREEFGIVSKKETTQEGNIVYTYSMQINGDKDIQVYTDVYDIKVEYTSSNNTEYIVKYMNDYWYVIDKEEYDRYEEWKNSDSDEDFELQFSYKFHGLENRVAIDRDKELNIRCEIFYNMMNDYKKGTFLSAKNNAGDIIPLEKMMMIRILCLLVKVIVH